jgi:3-hydroxyacyl-CoA dehydrogenase
MLSGEPVAAEKALALGIVDAVVEGDVVAGCRRARAGGRRQGRPRASSRDMLTLADRDGLRGAARSDRQRRSRRHANAVALIEAVRGGFTLPVAEGLKRRAQAVHEAAWPMSVEGAAPCFFAEREAAKVPGVPGGHQAAQGREGGVIGAGTMGGGIAMSFANAGIPVTLIETGQEQLERGLGTIARTTRCTAARGG